jgi:hypothetical protein
MHLTGCTFLIGNFSLALVNCLLFFQFNSKSSNALPELSKLQFPKQSQLSSGGSQACQTTVTSKIDQFDLWPANMTSNSSDNKDTKGPTQEPNNENVLNPSNVVKKFPPRGDWQLYRLASATNFTCDRCCKPKKAKLVAQSRKLPHIIHCNGCYGELISSNAQTSATSPKDSTSAEQKGPIKAETDDKVDMQTSEQ